MGSQSRKMSKPAVENAVVGPSPLAVAGWRYVEKLSLEDFRAGDWSLLNRQRRAFYAARQADHVLHMLALSEADPTFGYQINNYRHCLQSATMVHRAGLDEETVVVALLHDIGFVACPANHGAFAAALVGGYVDDRHHWMLLHHQIFQRIHLHEYDGADRNARERWRGHPYFDWTAQYVAAFDQNAIDPSYENAPLSFFAPMVHRLFSQPAKPLAVP